VRLEATALKKLRELPAGLRAMRDHEQAMRDAAQRVKDFDDPVKRIQEEILKKARVR
jgi:hypothetical protein